MNLAAVSYTAPMKNKAWKFSPARKAHVVNIEYERDYDHEAWQNADEAPTLKTCPDAFYSYASAAYPELQLARKERKPKPLRLSKTAMRKRLSRAGLRGADLRMYTNAFWQKPLLIDLHDEGHVSSGQMFMHWDVDDLKAYFGKRIAKAMMVNVKTIRIFMDEYGYYMGEGMAKAFTDMFRQARSTNTKVIMATQDLKDFAVC